MKQLLNEQIVKFKQPSLFILSLKFNTSLSFQLLQKLN